MTHLSFIIIKGNSIILEYPSSAQGGDTGRFTITLTHTSDGGDRHAYEKEFRNIEQECLKGDFERASRGIE